jgi:hypothetical protein
LPLIGDLSMKKFVLVLAVMAASCSIAAANELKQDKVLITAATQMTDAEMDKVTAGAASGWQICNPHGCHPVGGGGQSWHRNANNGYLHSNGHRGAQFSLIGP